jgi:hypothetical protein
MTHDLEIRGHVGLDSVHSMKSSVLVKVDNKHAVLLRDNNGTSANAAFSLDYLTGDREVREICLSSAETVAVEFPDAIEVFDLRGKPVLRHPKGQRDLILDLAFSQNAEYLIAISSDRYLVWRLDRGNNLYVLIPNDSRSLESCISPYQRPKIISMNGSPHFLVQDLNSTDRYRNVVVVDDSGPWVQTLKSDEGSIVSPVCMTMDNRELFAVVSPKTISRNLRHDSTYTLQRWAVSQGPNISIEAVPPITPRLELSIGKSSFSGPGKLSLASARIDRQNYAIVAQHDGRVFRTLLDAMSS